YHDRVGTLCEAISASHSRSFAAQPGMSAICIEIWASVLAMLIWRKENCSPKLFDFVARSLAGLNWPLSVRVIARLARLDATPATTPRAVADVSPTSAARTAAVRFPELPSSDESTMQIAVFETLACSRSRRLRSRCLRDEA